MILSDGEINLLVREASRNSAINRDGTTSQRIARAIEAKVIEKLSDKLRDGERYRFIRDAKEYSEGLAAAFYLLERWESASNEIDAAIDDAIKESK